LRFRLFSIPCLTASSRERTVGAAGDNTPTYKKTMRKQARRRYSPLKIFSKKVVNIKYNEK
jgi:hypothetical protein